MTITSQVFTPVAGSYTFSDASLAYVKLLRVCLEGMGFNRNTTLTSREFNYDPGAGSLTFLDPFPGNPANDVERVTLFVKYMIP